MATILGVADYYSLDYVADDYVIDAPRARFAQSVSAQLGGLVLLASADFVANFTKTASGQLVAGGSAQLASSFAQTVATSLLATGTATLPAQFTVTADYGIIRGIATINIDSLGTIQVTPGLIAVDSSRLTSRFSITTSASSTLTSGPIDFASAFAQNAQGGTVFAGAPDTFQAAFNALVQSGLVATSDSTLAAQFDQTATAGILFPGTAQLTATTSLTGTGNGIFVSGATLIFAAATLQAGLVFSPSQFRTYTIPEESGIYTVDGESRGYLIPQETRTYTFKQGE